MCDDDTISRSEHHAQDAQDLPHVEDSPYESGILIFRYFSQQEVLIPNPAYMIWVSMFWSNVGGVRISSQVKLELDISPQFDLILQQTHFSHLTHMMCRCSKLQPRLVLPRPEKVYKDTKVPRVFQLFANYEAKLVSRFFVNFCRKQFMDYSPFSFSSFSWRLNIQLHECLLNHW